MAFTSIAAPKFVITSRDDELNRSIIAKTVALGTGFADEFKKEMILLIRDVLGITPPNSGKLKGGQQAGQAAINRDLYLMGFVPVQIKGHRIISHVPAGNVKGRRAVAIDPVKVRTARNPKFENPDAFHAYRIRRRSEMGRRRVSRGGKQAFYVAASKYRSMKSRLYKEVGKLAAGWLPGLRAINNGALPGWVPSWIRRHQASVAGRGRYAFNFDPALGRLFIRLVNSMPDSANEEAEATQRRIEAAKAYRIGFIRRGLEGRGKRIARQRH